MLKVKELDSQNIYASSCLRRLGKANQEVYGYELNVYDLEGMRVEDVETQLEVYVCHIE